MTRIIPRDEGPNASWSVFGGKLLAVSELSGTITGDGDAVVPLWLEPLTAVMVDIDKRMYSTSSSRVPQGCVSGDGRAAKWACFAAQRERIAPSMGIADIHAISGVGDKDRVLCDDRCRGNPELVRI